MSQPPFTPLDVGRCAFAATAGGSVRHSRKNMHPSIEINSVWEDDGLFEIAICASNGKFCGEARCYTTRKEMGKLSQAIDGFPKSTADEVHFSTYSSDRLSYFSVHFLCTDGSGHVVVRVRVADIVVCANGRPDNNLAEFDLTAEPAAIDTFSSELARLAGANIGDVTAVLNGGNRPHNRT